MHIEYEVVRKNRQRHFPECRLLSQSNSVFDRMMHQEYAQMLSFSLDSSDNVCTSFSGGYADRIWQEIYESASTIAMREPLLTLHINKLILSQISPSGMLAAVLANRLACDDMPEKSLYEMMLNILETDEQILSQVEADLAAVRSRDPACPDHLHILLNLKGFHSLQAYRVTHSLFESGRTALAHALASRISLVFSVDIHPAARIGAGVMFDHATGIVIGETVVIDDDVSILQNVTLGGTGKEHGDRHPKICSGVMIGAGAKILGNIKIGAMSKIAAGSVVLKEVPPHCTVAGIPAVIVRKGVGCKFPSFEMNQMI
ncbi:MAG: serine O-acetyltransferase [Dehalococcoidales bacterium]|nr:serine O-acetyltransferase [Dehalococcoidales bacterium]